MASRLKVRFWVSAAGCAMAALGASGAQAQGAGQPQSSAEETTDEGDVIIVTARRKDEALSDVPISITAISAEEITKRAVESPEALRTVTAGLNVGGLTRDSANFFLRGQAPGARTSGARDIPGVATYFAEVPSELSASGTFYDLQNVQVLKGPQGTLFGRNTTGGAVLFEPQRPIHGFNGGSVELQYGNYDHKQFNGYVNVAVVPDKFAIRLAGEVQRRDGFTTSVITGQEKDNRRHEAVRASFLFTPSDSFENLTIVDYRHSDTGGTGLVIDRLNPATTVSTVPLPAAAAVPLSGILMRTINPGVLPLNLGGSVSVACLSANLAGCPAPIFGSTSLGAYAAVLNGGSFYLLAPTATFNQILATQAQIGPRQNQSPLITQYLDQHIAVVNKTTIRLSDDLALKNIISLRQRKQREILDFTGTPLPILQQTGPIDPGNERFTFGSRLFTEELQLQGEFGKAFNFILGGYYEKETPGIKPGTRGFQLGSASLRAFDRKDTSYAFFGHAEWQPIDILTLAAGVRHTWDKRTNEISEFSLNNTTGVLSCNQANLLTGAVQCPIANARNFKAWTYDFTVSLRPTDNLLVYGAYRRGYKGGGLNVPIIPGPASNPLAFASYGPEFVDDFEIGAKVDAKLGTVPLRFNLAAFRDDFKDQQLGANVQFTRIDGTVGFASSVQNIGASRAQGFEADLSLGPISGFTIGGFLSYLDAASKRDVVDALGRPVVFAGRQLQSQPKWKYGLNGSYTADLGDKGAITLSANYSWQGETFAAQTVTLRDVLDSYGVANARIGWEGVMGSNFDLALFANNVFDKLYIQNGFPVAQLGFNSVAYGAPRMYGLSVKLRFGDARK